MTEPTDVSSLVDLEAINAAAGRLAAIYGRLEAATADLDRAEAELGERRRHLPALIEAAASGEAPLTVESVDAAHDAIRQAANFATAFSAVRTRLEAMAERGEAALADAKHRGWRAVMLRGAELRVEAGRRLDLARLMAPAGSRAHEEAARREHLQAAAEDVRPMFDEGSKLIHLAVANGARMAEGAGWIPEWDGLSEKRERSHWSELLTEARTDAI